MAHQKSAININRLSWDDIRVFLACTKEPSFRQAAEKLNVSSSTVVRRIEQLETALGIRLFDRLPEGIRITQEARSIKDSALHMERSLFELLQNRLQADDSLEGIVNISISEGLGTLWLVPRLVNFQKQFPNLILNVQCSMRNADVLRLESDFAIQFQRPSNPELMVVKLARLHLYPFASEDYISIYGKPKTIKDVKAHRFVLQISSQVDEEKIWAEKLGLDSLDELVGIRTNSGSTLFYAIERGAGIGALPTYACALNAPVVPLDFGIQNSVDIWLTYHPGIKKTPRKALMLEWIKSIFDPQLYPWFSDDFIHPNELIDLMPDEAKVNINQNYFSVKPFGRD